jgi:NADP-dependent 3-hydroxy acid dehydrogenase YdfG
MLLSGKIALVTGGGSGIGTMMAATLVQNGAKVYIASRKEKQLKEVKPHSFTTSVLTFCFTQGLRSSE